MHPIPCHPLPHIDPAQLKALCAFAAEMSQLPDPRDPRSVRYPLAVLLGTLLVALAGDANTMAAVAEFTADHQAWFRLWLPLGKTVPTDDTYRLLERMVLEGAVVTIDAASCQRAIVQDLRAADADYVLAVKRNQLTLHAKVHAAFEEADRGAFTPEVQDRCETVKRNGGRRERRTCTVLGGPGLCEWVADPAEWSGLRSLIRVRTERNGPGGGQHSVRYCISSRPVDAEALLELVRGH